MDVLAWFFSTFARAVDLDVESRHHVAERISGVVSERSLGIDYRALFRERWNHATDVVEVLVREILKTDGHTV